MWKIFLLERCNMVTKEQLEKLNKDDLILYNELLEKDIKEVAYFACLNRKSKRISDTLLFRTEKQNRELKQQLSCFIGYKS